MAQTSAPLPLAANLQKSASRVMSRAFLNDPLWKYLVPDDARRARVVPLSMGILVRYSFLYGEIFTTPTLGGIACWLTPGKTTPTLRRLVWIGIHNAPLQLGWTGFRRYTAVENYSGEVHKRAVPGMHWYLWGLGVEPSRQGQGIGGLLIQPVLARADASDLPCYLETMNKKNVSFYVKHGFKIVSDEEVPRHGLRVWAMLREPR
jgi:ribosomal protein S18 acetylase RimI-like enzyme